MKFSTIVESKQFTLTGNKRKEELPVTKGNSKA